MDSGFKQYQVIFKDHAGNMFGAELLPAFSDQAAVEDARTKYRMGIGAGYEIWLGDRLVHTERFTQP